MLVHYYFMFIAGSIFLSTVSYILNEEKKNNKYKEDKQLVKYIQVFIVSAISYLIIYPSFFTHLFTTGRGGESAKNLVNIGDYLIRIKTVHDILTEYIFANAVLILPVLVTLLICAYIKKSNNMNKGILEIINIVKKDYNKVININRNLLTAVILTIIYLAVITKIIPFNHIRYLLPVIPYIFIILVYVIRYITKILIQSEIITNTILVLLSIGFISISILAAWSNPFLYIGSNEIYSKLENDIYTYVNENKIDTADIIYYYNNEFFWVNNDIRKI